MRVSLRTAGEQAIRRTLESDVKISKTRSKSQMWITAKRSVLRNGLTRRQRSFVLEKLTGLSDKDAALAAGYSLSVAENTKQRIWKPRVCREFERLLSEFSDRLLKERAHA